MIGKVLPQEPVTQAETGLRRNCAPFHQYWYQCVQRNINVPRAVVVVRNGGAKTLAVADLHATLVLEPEAPDFSTEAGNSALIVTTKSPQAL
jgi:hypothetical protein